jgi:SAM-dependent methyltransferase
VVDRLFSDPALATWYDAFCGWDQRDDLDFYLPFVMSARSVLDVGCGTGLLLRRARELGHAGRLLGLDPADAMLDVARERADVEWVLGDLGSVEWKDEFDLVVMTGHAFQVLVGDEELRTALAAIRMALADAGRFAFETRNPVAREWERWTPENAVEATDPTGLVMQMAQRVQSVDGDLVRFMLAFTSPAWEAPRVSESTLRFLDAASLSRFLVDAGLYLDEQFGDWDRSPLTDVSPEIITIARRG